VKKALIVTTFMVLIALGALLVAPAFIDWNSYRRDVAAAIADATGREVTIAGDLDLSILPLPRLTVRRVSVASVAGATDPVLLRIGELRLELAVAPLLTGRIAVRSLSLVEPAMTLETTADGRHSWDFTRARPARVPSGLITGISVGTVSISKGRLLWLSADSGPNQLDAIEAKLSITGPNGAADIRGSAVFKAVPFRFLAIVGQIGNDGLAPVSAVIDIAGDAGTVAVTGRADVRGPRADGTIRLAAPDAAQLSLALGHDLKPAIPAWRVAAESEFSVDRDNLVLRDIAIAYGEIRGTGLAELAFDETPALAAKLRIAAMDLDDMLAAMGPAKRASRPRSAWKDVILPRRFTADFDLSIRAARWRGGVVRDIGASVRATPGGLVIERMAMKLPGGTGVTMSGTVEPYQRDLRLQGDLAIISDNLRAALVWAGAADDELPSDRLRNFSYTSGITVTRDAVHLARIAARLDATRMTGAATIARQQRPSFGLRLRLDRLGLDAYLPPWLRRERDAVAIDTGVIPWAARFDANLNLFVDSLTVRSKTISRVALDARLFDGDVVLRNLTIDDLGGATLSASGKIDDLPVAPRGDFEIALEAGDTERFAGFIEINPGSITPRVGRFRLYGHASGTADSTAVEGTLDIAGGEVRAEGLLSGLDGRAGFDLAVTVSHPDSDRVFNLFAPGRHRGEIGVLAMKFGVAGTADALTIRNLDAALGKMKIAGRIDATLDDERPKAIAALSAGLLDIDRLWPAAPQPYKKFAMPLPRGSAHWSREAIDLSALRALDLDLTLRSDTVVRGNVRIDRMDLRTKLRDGVLTVDHLTGSLFGGNIEASGRIDSAASSLGITARVSGRDIATRQALDAIAAIDRLEGPASFSLSLSATGHSPFDLVSSLSGSGALLGRLQAQQRGDRPIPAGPGGDAVDAILKALAGTTLALRADFGIEHGIARTNNMSLHSDAVQALTLGAVDLPHWRISATTTVHHQGEADLPEVLVRLGGPLGDPEVELSGAAVAADRHQAPAPDAVPVVPVEPVPPAAEDWQTSP